MTLSPMQPSEKLDRGISLLRGERQAVAYLEGQQQGLSLDLPEGTYRVEWLDPIESELIASEEVSVVDALRLSPPLNRDELAVGVTPKE